MFFKKSTQRQRQLQEALCLVKRASHLTAPYLYEEGYQPTEVEVQLLKALHHAHGQAHAYTQHVMATLWGLASSDL